MTRGYIIYIKQRALDINQTGLGRSNKMPSIGATGKGGSRQMEKSDAGSTSHNAGTSYCIWRMKAGQGKSKIRKEKRSGETAFWHSRCME